MGVRLAYQKWSASPCCPSIYQKKYFGVSGQVGKTSTHFGYLFFYSSAVQYEPGIGHSQIHFPSSPGSSGKVDIIILVLQLEMESQEEEMTCLRSCISVGGRTKAQTQTSLPPSGSHLPQCCAVSRMIIADPMKASTFDFFSTRGQ